MASKIALVSLFVLLVICQVCLSSRLPRDSQAIYDSSSESLDGENLDQMAEIIQKYLSQKDADDAKKIVNDINTAKDPEQSVDGYIKLIELGIKAIANQYETDNSTTIAALKA